VKLGLLAASLVLVAGGAVGCGGDDDGGGASGTASVKEFCGALKEFKDDLAGQDPGTDPEAVKAYVQSLKTAANRLDDVGTPKEIPAAAEAGFALTVKRIRDLSDDATVDDLAALGDVSDEDRKKLDALDEYIDKTCPDLDDQGEESPAG
jgi:hypothetical protein